jgi:hypothetical protein
MSNSWWTNKLNGQQPPQQSQQLAPYQRPVYQPQPVPQAPQQPQVLPQSAMTASRCPGCGSGNYGGATPESRPRCYDCGYPITQSGTGMPGVHLPSNGNTVAATQISTANNFNPQTIIGKLG